MIPVEAEASSHVPRSSVSCPKDPLSKFEEISGAAASRSLYDARPSLSAAAGAAVTRNVELLSDL